MIGKGKLSGSGWFWSSHSRLDPYDHEGTGLGSLVIVMEGLWS